MATVKIKVVDKLPRIVKVYVVSGLGIVCEACIVHFGWESWSVRPTSGKGLNRAKCLACNLPFARESANVDARTIVIRRVK